MFRPALAASAVALALAGCSASGSAPQCAGVNFAAPYAVTADPADPRASQGQRWINRTIEAGVRTCGHERPGR